MVVQEHRAAVTPSIQLGIPILSIDDLKKAASQNVAEPEPENSVIFQNVFGIDCTKSKLSARTVRSGDSLEVVLETDLSDLVLHWGVAQRSTSEWLLPAESMWPEETVAFDKATVRTPFVEKEEGQYVIRMNFHNDEAPLGLHFVLNRTSNKSWLKSNGRNFFVRTQPPRKSLLAPIRKQVGECPDVKIVSFALENELLDIDGYVFQNPEQGKYVVWLVTDNPSFILHWGVYYKKGDWKIAPAEHRPPGSTQVSDLACELAFPASESGVSAVEFVFPVQGAPKSVCFVLKQVEINAAGKETVRWVKHHNDNFCVDMRSSMPGQLPAGMDRALTERIVEAEVDYTAWTLMHRFNLCRDLLPVARKDEDKMALLYVWLRYSFIRQLDWQRRYNTQPRILSEAQNQLTMALTDLYKEEPKLRWVVRMMLATLGKGGGNGQRIRDEILIIMHKHGIGENPSTFMEQWHQKLHNNTTPDDVIICEAFLAFLGSGGNQQVFYNHCASKGVTRERMASYDRSIRAAPDMYWHCKDSLIGHFNEYLRILKSVHCGTDMDTVAESTRHWLDGGMNCLLNEMLGARGSWDTVTQCRRVADFRRNLRNQMERSSSFTLRDLIFMDVAVEDLARLAVEGMNLNADDLDLQLLALGQVLESVCLSIDEVTLWDSLAHLNKLKMQPVRDRDRLLHAKALMDRIKLSLGLVIDKFHRLFQVKAEVLGKAFSADTWCITLFTEEVVRGTCLASVSQILRRIDPVLRKRADLGNWQIISPGKGYGELEVLENLAAVQNKKYTTPTTMFVARISGEEEIPDGVSAVVTSDQPDILSHVAVRARNQNVLFATCYSEDEIAKVKKLAGKVVSMEDNNGQVRYYEGKKGDDQHASSATQGDTKLHITLRPVRSSAPWMIPSSQFAWDILGGKSNNLNGLRGGKLPSWIHFPTSAALPFGSCERVLQHPLNQTANEQYLETLPALRSSEPLQAMTALRNITMSLDAPDDLIHECQQVLSRDGPKMDAVCSWDEAWRSIKSVWASKWNERAHIAASKVGLDQAEVKMAVLVQEVVEAEYAFVIHTTNPFTRDQDEIYAELVVGLGETLVGAYAGRALSFSAKKANIKEPRLLGYPSKVHALFGSGLIFRSDSNGEDLEGYAGAGLYDSVLAKPASEEVVRYTQEALMWDHTLRHELMAGVVEIGLLVEKALGSPQDIEGAYSRGKFYIVQTRPQV